MVSDVGIGISFGKRIELARRRRGLSRELLGDLIGRSSEWIRQVERDDRPVDRLSVLLLLAKTLKVADVGAFLGCAVPEAPAAAPAARVAAANPLREILYTQRFPGRTPGGAPAGPEGGHRLRQVLETLWAAWHTSPRPYTLVLQGLPELIASLDEREEETSAHAHRLAAILLRRLGDPTAALLAAERAVAAARASGVAVAEAACAAAFADTLVSLGLPARAGRVCLDALAHPGSSPVEGTLHLVAAEAAVADDDHVAAQRFLDRARQAAQRHGDGGKDTGGPGPADVEAAAVRVALRVGRPGQALRIAQTVEVPRIRAVQRRARHYLTVAWAHARQDTCPATVFALLKAEEACPEEVRYNPEAHQLVHDLMRRDNALVRQDVWALAERTGLA